MVKVAHGHANIENPSSVDTLTEVSLDLIINDVLHHGALNEERTKLVFGRYRIGQKGIVYSGNRVIGIVENWSKIKRGFNFA